MLFFCQVKKIVTYHCTTSLKTAPRENIRFLALKDLRQFQDC